MRMSKAIGLATASVMLSLTVNLAAESASPSSHQDDPTLKVSVTAWADEGIGAGGIDEDLPDVLCA